MVKFAHMSDCHLGSWSNHPDMRDYPAAAFESALDKCIKEGVDFVIIAGDLFDTSLPPIDILKRATAALRKCKEAGLPVYAVPGSHDYSPTGKTMLSVLEEAGLLVDVCKFDVVDGKVKLKITVDGKTGVKLTGIMGRKGGLDVNYYRDIDRSIEKEDGFKIFVFHAGIEDYRPGNMIDMLAVPISDLPKGFNYYATGHIHQKFFDEKHMIVFPGELFPTSFDELEVYNGGFIIAEEKNGKIGVKWIDNHLFDVALLTFDATGKSGFAVHDEMMKSVRQSNLKGKVLLLKASGTLESGRLFDIDFNKITETAKEAGALVVKRSTSGVSVKEFEEIDARESLSAEQVEKGLIEQHSQQLMLTGVSDVADFVANMMNALNLEKQEDETNATFEERVKSAAKKVVGL